MQICGERMKLIANFFSLKARRFFLTLVAAWGKRGTGAGNSLIHRRPHARQTSWDFCFPASGKRLGISSRVWDEYKTLWGILPPSCGGYQHPAFVDGTARAMVKPTGVSVMERTSISFPLSELDVLRSKAATVEAGLRCLAALLDELGVCGPARESGRLMGLAALLRTQADRTAELLDPLDPEYRLAGKRPHGSEGRHV
jgi:hypothetical protein